jgi:hypothetical protein
MKKFTHAWIAFKAIERLKNADLDDANRKAANFLIRWFENHKDGVIRGAWYPDSVIVDNGTSHIMKYRPDAGVPRRDFGKLPLPSLLHEIFHDSPQMEIGFRIDPKYNLPQRCEALSHAIIDNFKIQQYEEKGSALSPSDHHNALLIFMLSHYIADAHMPLHCDDRPGTIDGFDLHDAIERTWEEEVVRYYEIDRVNQRFLYDPGGLPKLKDESIDGYAHSMLKAVQDELNQRHFQFGYGAGNDNVLEYMHTISRYSYLMAYAYLPQDYTLQDFDRDTLQMKNGSGMPFRDMSIIALSDAIDAVAHIWLHDVRRFMKWEREN